MTWRFQTISDRQCADLKVASKPKKPRLKLRKYLKVSLKDEKVIENDLIVRLSVSQIIPQMIQQTAEAWAFVCFLKFK